jgi:Tfp pilus assembly protein PilV
MSAAPARARPPRGEREGGFALIEVLISAVIAVTMSTAVFGLLTAAGHSGAEDRHRTQAYSLTQEDQARMRGMRLSVLNGYTRANQPISLNGTEYKVSSKAFFVNNNSGTTSCEKGNSSVDYVRLVSEVTWVGTNGRTIQNPSRIESIMTPSNGSLDPTHGSLVFQVNNASNVPIKDVSLNTTGSSNPATLSGKTDEKGCAIFIDQPEGSYSVLPSGFAAGYVDEEDEAPKARTWGITGGTTKTVQLHYDIAGTINANFKVRPYGTGNPEPVPAPVDSVRVLQNQWTAQEQAFGTVGATRKTPYELKSLYPFKTSSYTFWAGTCAADKPPTEVGMLGSAAVTPGITTAATAQLPAFYPTIKGETKTGTIVALAGATVTVEDEESGCEGVRRFAPTNASGQITEPGLPYSTYKVCASGTVTAKESTTPAVRRVYATKVSVKSLTGTALTLEIKGASEKASC